MASIIPVFELVKDGTGTTAQEAWIDLGVIPNNKRIWFGFATYISEDKQFSFELRTNKSSKSVGTTADTTLHDYAAAPTGESIDRDYYQFANILMQSVLSTGVEHWWLRIRSKSGSAGDFSYIIYYTEY
jgi:hypothetical protein